MLPRDSGQLRGAQSRHTAASGMGILSGRGRTDVELIHLENGRMVELEEDFNFLQARQRRPRLPSDLHPDRVCMRAQ